MTFLLINYEYPPIGAGAANATRHIAKALVELGHQAIVLTAGFHDSVGHSIEEGGINVYRLPSRRASISQSNPREMLSFVWHAWCELKQVVRAHKPHFAFIFFSIPCGLLGPTLKKRFGIPYTILLRGGDVPGMEPGLDAIHWLLTPLRRHVLSNAHAIIANSPGLAEVSQKADPFPVHVVPNGVDTSFFRPPDKPPTGPFTFLFVGRFQHVKNLPVVLDAFAAGFRGTNVRLKLIGDGPQKEQLQRQILDLGIDKQVDMLPWQDKQVLLHHYQNAHCLINYSVSEGMPNVVLEAMACGLSLILSDVTGHAGLCEANDTAILIAPHDTGGLAKAMVQIRETVESDNHLLLQSEHSVGSWTFTAKSFLNTI